MRRDLPSQDVCFRRALQLVFSPLSSVVWYVLPSPSPLEVLSEHLSIICDTSKALYVSKVKNSLFL